MSKTNKRKKDKMNNDEFPGDLKPFNEITPARREFLIEHYRRCEAFWRHWTPTIWSIPSVATAINVGAYTLLFGPGKEAPLQIQILVLLILLLLNSALTVGVYRHRHMQQQFGKRILAIERYFEFPIVKLSQTIRGSLIYFFVMVVISLISLGLLIYKAVCGS